MVVDRDLESKRSAEDRLERRDVTVGGPQLEFRVAVRTQARQVIVPARIEIQTSDRLCVAAIESLGEAHHRRERLHRLAQAAIEVSITLV
jgi:hypothetical protein